MQFDSIAVTLAARQTPDSRFSHFEGTSEELIALVQDTVASDATAVLPTAREGIVKVRVDPAQFKTGMVKLEPNQVLFGLFEARQKGEYPRKVVMTKGEKLDAKYCEIIMYHRDVLLEEEGYEPAAEWEIISVNAAPEATAVPMAPETLMYNHFGMDGGTSMGLTDEQFVSALRQSLLYWHDKCMCG